jgi:predicted RNA binding protein YcfA (HicA-like mRNA interferase family)
VKLPRDLAGKALVAVLIRDWGYRQLNQVGSHVILETLRSRRLCRIP